MSSRTQHEEQFSVVKGLPSEDGQLHSGVVRNVSRNFPPHPSNPPEANDDEMRRRDKEVELLKAQLKAAQAQIASQAQITLQEGLGEKILGEIQNLSKRVAKIEEAIMSECTPHTLKLNYVEAWLNNHCDNSYCESKSSHSM